MIRMILDTDTYNEVDDQNPHDYTLTAFRLSDGAESNHSQSAKYIPAVDPPPPILCSRENYYMCTTEADCTAAGNFWWKDGVCRDIADPTPKPISGVITFGIEYN